MFIAITLLFTGLIAIASAADIRPIDPVTKTQFVPIRPGPSDKSLSPVIAALRLLAFTTPNFNNLPYIPNPSNIQDHAMGKLVHNAARSMWLGASISEHSLYVLVAHAMESDPTKFVRRKTFDAIDIYFEFRRVLDETLKQVGLDEQSLSLKVRENGMCELCYGKSSVEKGTVRAISQTAPDLKLQLANASPKQAICMARACLERSQSYTAMPNTVQSHDVLYGEPRQVTVLLPRDGTRFEVKKELIFNDSRYLLKAALEEDLLSADRYGVLFIGNNNVVTKQTSTNNAVTNFCAAFAPTFNNTTRPILLVYQMETRAAPSMSASTVNLSASTLNTSRMSASTLNASTMSASTLVAKHPKLFQNLPDWPQFEFMRPALILLAFLFKDLPKGTNQDYLLQVLSAMQERTGVNFSHLSGVVEELEGVGSYANKPECLLQALFQMLPNGVRSSSYCQTTKLSTFVCTLCETALPSDPTSTILFNVDLESLTNDVTEYSLNAFLAAMSVKKDAPSEKDTVCAPCNSITTHTATEQTTLHPKKLLFVTLTRQPHALHPTSPHYIHLTIPKTDLATSVGQFRELVAFVEQVDEGTFVTWVKLGEHRWLRVSKAAMKVADPNGELNGYPQFTGPRILVYSN